MLQNDGLEVEKISYDPPEVNRPVWKDRHTVDLDRIDCWLSEIGEPWSVRKSDFKLCLASLGSSKYLYCHEIPTNAYFHKRTPYKATISTQMNLHSSSKNHRP